ncbi:MAG: ABC transporter substrate-binding protein [Chloroflexi bacterium]|nr:ABC transporter substrate-binding protein [Chloroflexota bacterium]
MVTESKNQADSSWSRHSRRSFLKGALGAAALGALGASPLACTIGGTAQPSGPKTLRIMLNGGQYENVARKLVVEPFEKKYGVTVEITPGTSAEMVSRLKAEKASPTQDLIIVDDFPAAVLIGEGLVEKVNADNVPNMKDLAQEALDPSGYGPIVHSHATVIVYNKNLVKVKPPESWADLWKPEYKNVIVPPAINIAQGVLFLLQAAVMNGGGYDNIEPGFEAVKRLSPNVRKYWKAIGDVRPLFDEDVFVLTGINIWNDEANKGRPVAMVVPKEGGLAAPARAEIVKGTKARDLAEKFINEYLSPEAQAGWSREYVISVFNKKAVIPEEVKAKLAQKLLVYDSNKIAERQGAWVERWMREIQG